jgi:SCY1-like protein 1
MLPFAKNALRKLRTIRHPDVLKFIDVVETESTIYIVTERVQPLGIAISSWGSKSAAAREEWLIWGIHRIAVRFLSYFKLCLSPDGELDSTILRQ